MLARFPSPGLRRTAGGGAFDLRQPPRRAVPLVVASPHSGAESPEEFLAASPSPTASTVWPARRSPRLKKARI